VGLLVMELWFVFAKREEGLRCEREKSSRGGGDCLVRDKFRFRVFFVFFSFNIAPPLLCVVETSIYR
jgi:hypothetical protein